MDTRVELLNEFYQTMCKDKVKIEDKHYGFSFVDELTADETKLDYVQVEKDFIHKYRLLNVTKARRRQLFIGHVSQAYNVCLYFNETANNIFCFNLDNNFKKDNNEIIPELRLAADYVVKELARYGMEAVTVESGRGYHQWCQLKKPVDNELLLKFMIRISARALAALQYSGHDYHAVKINMSPNPKFVNIISLRAFGSRHIKTGGFSHVVADGRVLGEEDSWQYISDYLVNKTISEECFMYAYQELARAIAL